MKRLFFSVLFFAGFLALLSIPQKLLLDASILDMRGYLVPVIFGAFTGYLYYLLRKKDYEKMQMLEALVEEKTSALLQTNRKLELALINISDEKDKLKKDFDDYQQDHLISGLGKRYYTPLGAARITNSYLQQEANKLKQDLARGKVKSSHLQNFLDTVDEFSTLQEKTLLELINLTSFLEARPLHMVKMKSELVEIPNLFHEIQKRHPALFEHFQVSFRAQEQRLYCIKDIMERVLTSLFTYFKLTYPKESPIDISMEVHDNHKTITFHLPKAPKDISLLNLLSKNPDFATLTQDDYSTGEEGLIDAYGLVVYLLHGGFQIHLDGELCIELTLYEVCNF